MAASNGNAPQSFDTVLSALNTLQSNVERSQKAAAHEYLDKFQKAVCLQFPCASTAVCANAVCS